VQSPYTPGRRGKSWLKLKKELATLDVVVTAVEWGHGKRNKVLSDYTFAVRDGDKLLNVGKAYSGLTDVEIAEMTEWFKAHTLEDQGFRRTVEAKIVLEVAFNNMMQSSRHESGYALRFPRILRLRTDKSVDEIDTLDTVKDIFARQAKAPNLATDNTDNTDLHGSKKFKIGPLGLANPCHPCLSVVRFAFLCKAFVSLLICITSFAIKMATAMIGRRFNATRQLDCGTELAHELDL